MNIQNTLTEVRHHLIVGIPLEGSEKTYPEQQLIKAIMIYEKRKGWRNKI